MNVFELYDRGLANIDALTDVERKLFIVHDFQLIHEMEGFTHYFGSYRNVHIHAIRDFLREVGAPNIEPLEKMISLISCKVPSWDPDEVDHYFCDIVNDEDEDEDRSFARDPETEQQIEDWGTEFYEGVGEMWDSIARYLRTHHGIELDF